MVLRNRQLLLAMCCCVFAGARHGGGSSTEHRLHGQAFAPEQSQTGHVIVRGLQVEAVGDPAAQRVTGVGQILADPSHVVMSGVACNPLHGISNGSSRAAHGNQLTEFMVEVDDE